MRLPETGGRRVLSHPTMPEGTKRSLVEGDGELMGDGRQLAFDLKSRTDFGASESGASDRPRASASLAGAPRLARSPGVGSRQLS